MQKILPNTGMINNKNNMKLRIKALFIFLIIQSVLPSIIFAQNMVIAGPDNNLAVNIFLAEGRLYYSVSYQDKLMLEKSPLGLKTSIADLSKGLKLINQQRSEISKTYSEKKIKKSEVHYNANELVCSFENENKQRIDVIFRVSNNDIAFRYFLPQIGNTSCCIIEKEVSGFKFPSYTTTFLTPQATPMIGWERTKPSYEEEYVPDESIGTGSTYGVGYTFPGLFHVGDSGWILLSETGVNSLYCGSKLSESSKDGLYTISFPEKGENNGMGNANPAIALPGYTPWRTLTVADNLKPIVETTIPFDVVEPLYKASKDYEFGRSTWSWLLWQDESINYDDQKTFIDLSAQLGYEFTLIDGWWDTKIGREKIEELIKYASSKNVGVCLWYNSNGFWNDAPQGPKNCMNTSTARKREMAWMKSLGVKGIKVDFFGGDKQETMKLYEDILSDANDYGLVVIFHGCTLPRGWERMYPNFVGSEAVLASENLIFTQKANDNEAYNSTLHPFIRNSVGAMDFGPVLLNKRHNRNNNGGSVRKTTEIFQLATSVLFQAPVQNFGITPNNLTEYPAFIIDFMKDVPTVWDETVFIDGYPGKYCILARRHNQKWYVVGVNAEKEAKKINIKVPMLAGSKVKLYTDKTDRTPQMERVDIKKTGEIVVTIESGGGVILLRE